VKLPRSFYQRIGSKGGRNGKWSIAKRESARNAARIRWGRIPKRLPGSGTAAQTPAKHD
jgi:hypothetical protein